MSEILTPSRRIAGEVTSWDGVTSGIGSRGELSFKVNHKEIGHLHGDTVAHFFFRKDLWAELKAADRITHHPVFPGKEGPAARRIAGDDDIRDVIAMMRMNYELMKEGRAGRQAA